MTTRLKNAIKALLGKDSDVKNYAAGDYTRLTADWPTSVASPSAILRYSLSTMRARSRELTMNNDYARRFISMVGVHVIGPNGIALQVKTKFPDGRLDKWANDRIENAWYEWRQRGNYDVTGTLSGLDADRLFAQSVARDGETIIRVLPYFENKHGFALQFLEPDHLDEGLNVERHTNGNKITMGVEQDKWGRPVAYHLLTQHPGDQAWTFGNRKYTRVPASSIIHPYISERFGQPRGVPWMHSAMTRLNNIGAYEEASIIGARIASSKMGFYERNGDSPAQGSLGNTLADGTDAAGRPIAEVEPGMIETLPEGYTFKAADWSQPAGEFGPFMKASLRGIASGLGVSYNSLASDLEGVNYSSIRAGVLEERDVWKILQAWTADNYLQPIYEKWLEHMMITNQVNLPLSRKSKFVQVQWQARTWAWVDPEKDINSNIMAIDNGLTSRTRVAAENGMDFEELLQEIQQEQELIKKYGVKFQTADEKKKPTDSRQQTEADDDDEDDKKEDGEEKVDE